MGDGACLQEEFHSSVSRLSSTLRLFLEELIPLVDSDCGPASLKEEALRNKWSNFYLLSKRLKAFAAEHTIQIDLGDYTAGLSALLSFNGVEEILRGDL